MRIQLYIFLLLSFSNSLIGQPLSFESRGISGGSALFNPSFNPYNGDAIYLASDLTGMFFTENSGASWDIVPFYELRATPYSNVYFTADPNIVYCIHNDFEVVKQRIAKSTDGGQSWQILPTEPTDGAFLKLFVNPNAIDQLLIADYEAIYFSNDGGESFEFVYSAFTPELYVADVIWDEDGIYVGTSKGLIASQDGGSSFENLEILQWPSDLGILSLTGKKDDSGELRLFCTARNQLEMWPEMLAWESNYYGSQRIYELLAVGESTFEAQDLNESLATFWDFPFFMNAGGQINIFSSGSKIDPTGSYFHPQVYKFDEEQASWNPLIDVVNNTNVETGYMGFEGDLGWSWAETAMSFGTDPNNENRAIFTDFSFAHLTNDGGETWEALYVLPEERNSAGANTPTGKIYQSNGLENTSCWWLTWPQENEIFAAYTDITATRSLDNGQSWSFQYDGLIDEDGIKYNTIYHVSEAEDGKMYASASSIHDIYQTTHLTDYSINNSFSKGALFVSEDDGLNWDLVRKFEAPVIWSSIDPENEEIAYVSVVNVDETIGGIYKTVNLQDGQGAEWELLPAPDGTEGHPFNVIALENGEVVCTYSARRENDLFTASSGVFFSGDGGQIWENRSAPEMTYYTRDIVIDKNDPSQGTWYVGVWDGFSTNPETQGLGGLFRTKDKGESWQELGDFFRVFSVSIHPLHPEIAYVTTESEGLWYTENLNDEQPHFELLESYPFQGPTRVFFNPFNMEEVWVTSFGNGIRMGEELIVSHEEILTASPEVKVYPNPVSGNISINLPKGYKSAKIKLVSGDGKIIDQFEVRDVGTYLIPDHLSEGTYYLNFLFDDNQKATEEILILKK